MAGLKMSIQHVSHPINVRFFNRIRREEAVFHELRPSRLESGGEVSFPYRQALLDHHGLVLYDEAQLRIEVC